MSDFDPVRFTVAMVVVIFSCVFHECAHVWMAMKFGDHTGRLMGRLTLNPLAHVDPFWTVLLPVFTYLQSGFPLGGPKPAPVNPHEMRDPRLGGVSSALAGPASNLILALAGLFLLMLFHRVMPDFVHPGSLNALLFFNLWYINGALALANLIPVPPLDGSRFLHYLVGPPLDPLMNLVDRAGFLTAIPIYFAFRFIAPYALGPFAEGTGALFSGLFGDAYADELFRNYTGS